MSVAVTHSLGDVASPGKVEEAVKFAIDIGYRHFDCAYLYKNESEIGDGIQQKIKEGVVKREDLFVVSKLWCTFHKRSLVKGACQKSLAFFSPRHPERILECSDARPWSPPSQPRRTSLLLECLFAMEELVDAGLVKAIGISNFNHKQIERLLTKPGLKFKPANNQVNLTHKDLYKDYSLLLTGGFSVSRIPVLYSQVLIRFHIQRNVAVIPKSDKPHRIEENLKVRFQIRLLLHLSITSSYFLIKPNYI
uniref:NADP-dependent oxidoreductase domain-containing protein n=1 Tax=Chelonoidis abingdonii TaxID=106734 RepID=A0A8C0G793_CHEAB